MKTVELMQVLDDILSVKRFKDYAPNGLQIQGKQIVEKIICGVTASQALIDVAIERKADAVIVHHGYFWKGEDPKIVGMKYRRIASLIKHDINLFGYHLPLDAHPELGNNAGLADALGLTSRKSLQAGVELADSIGLVGVLPVPMPVNDFLHLVKSVVNRNVLFEKINDRPIQIVALCTGGAQGYIDQAIDAGADVFITGEVSEQTIHIAREMGIHFCAAGHHATERYGPQALARYLKESMGLDAEFVDIDNPA